MSEWLKSARKNETFVTRAADTRSIGHEKRGRKGGQQPFSLCFVLSFSDSYRGEWLTFCRPRRRSSGRKRLPSKYWFARPRNARVANACRIKGCFLPDRPFVLGLLRIGFPSRNSAFLLGARSGQVFSRVFLFRIQREISVARGWAQK